MTDSQTIDYSVIIPVYNSGPRLAELIDRLQNVFTDVLDRSFEVILIDDGSTRPETRQVLTQLASRDFISAVRLSRNFGKPGAVMCGLSLSRGNWVITIDDDLQQRPEDIPKLVTLDQHDVVTATHEQKNHTFLQRTTSRIKQFFDGWILGYDVKLSPLKLIRRHVVDGMLDISTNRPFIPALIRQVTTDIVAVETSHDPSAYHQSRYSLSKRISQFSNLLIGNSNFMMQVFSWVGSFFAFLSFILVGIIVIRNILGFEIQAGWSSLMIAILLVGGLNLAAIGISGQYFIRILDISSNKPAFIIREVIGRGEKPESTQK